jgi:hypothetical protein
VTLLDSLLFTLDISYRWSIILVSQADGTKDIVSENWLLFLFLVYCQRSRSIMAKSYWFTSR